MPVGSEFFSDGLVNPKLLALFSHSLTERLSLMYNVGPSFVREYFQGSSETTKSVDLEYTAMLTGALTGGSSWFVELFGGFLSGQNSDEHTFQTGATALLTNNFQLDARAGVGLVENVPDWLVGVGLSWRLPR